MYKATGGAVLILAAIVIGDGYLRTRQANQRQVTLEASVARMSIQQLARLSAECDAAQSPGAQATHDAGYCAEVWREIEARPLQAVKVPSPPSYRRDSTAGPDRRTELTPKGHRRGHRPKFGGGRG